MKTYEEIKEEIINENYFLMKAISQKNLNEVVKRKILLDNLIKLLINEKN